MSEPRFRPSILLLAALFLFFFLRRLVIRRVHACIHAPATASVKRHTSGHLSSTLWTRFEQLKNSRTDKTLRLLTCPALFRTERRAGQRIVLRVTCVLRIRD